METRGEGPVATLPGGVLRMALGASVRHEDFEEDKATLIGSSTTSSSFKNNRTVGAAYAELAVPVIGDHNALPLVQKLDIDLAVRYDHYSDFGGTTNPKVSLKWALIDSLSLHGSYAHSFRAPTLYDSALSPNNNAYVDLVPDPSVPSG